jgi:hypothetical protein
MSRYLVQTLKLDWGKLTKDSSMTSFAYASIGMARKITQKDAVAVYLKADFDLLQKYKDSGTPHRCQCRRCGSRCTATYTSVRLGQRGCKKCKAVLMRQARILDSTEVDKLFRASGMEPLAPYLGASKPRKSRCLTCGKICTPTYTTLSAERFVHLHTQH